MPTPIRDFIRDLGIDAYVVGGAVRDELLGIPHEDEDFVVPGVDHAGLRALLEPHGAVEDMDVHGQLVGVRFFPRDRTVRELAPAGIEVTPPRAERSTGPGHRHFEIAAGPDVSLEEDMGRRDFTVNAIARRLSTGELVDPFDGGADIRAGVLRAVSDTTFSEDPLRILRGLRLISQLGFTLAPGTEAQMRRDVAGLAHISAERIGGGLASDGMGELSKLLLGRDPVRALRVARDVGALTQVIPAFSEAIGYGLGIERQPLPLDEHLFAVVGGVAGTVDLTVLLAALLHDLGKPTADETGESHAAVGARIAGEALRRLRYPTRLRQEVVTLIREHAFAADEVWDGVAVRRFLALHGERGAARLVALKRADLAAKNVPDAERIGLETLEAGLSRERTSPHRLTDLAVDGSDLIAIGLREGPHLGSVLRRLLDAVIEDPALNDRARLLELAGADQ
jgi:tRNA nucleotidyltransferase (CCA-adding enzyme)